MAKVILVINVDAEVGDDYQLFVEGLRQLVPDIEQTTYLPDGGKAEIKTIDLDGGVATSYIGY